MADGQGLNTENTSAQRDLDVNYDFFSDTPITWQELSLDQRHMCVDRPSRRTPKGYKEWFVTGALASQWNESGRRIHESVINANCDDIFGRSGAQLLPSFKYSLRLLSQTAELCDAEPFVIISSKNVKQAQEIVNYFRTHSYLCKFHMNYMARYDDSTWCSDNQSVSEPWIATSCQSAANRTSEHSRAVGSSDLLQGNACLSFPLSLSGARVAIHMFDASCRVVCARTATVGGVLEINGKYLALTAAHVFSQSFQIPLDQADCGSFACDNSVVGHLGHPQPALQYNIFVQNPLPHNEQRLRSSHDEDFLLGTFGPPITVFPEQRSEDRPHQILWDPEQDWALIELQDSLLWDLGFVGAPGRPAKRLNAPPSDQSPPNGTLAIAAGISGIVEGRGVATSGTFSSPMSRTMMEMWSVERDVVVGDSGSLVYDPTCDMVMGLVVSSSRGDEMTHFVPATLILPKIAAHFRPKQATRETTSATPTLCSLQSGPRTSLLGASDLEHRQAQGVLSGTLAYKLRDPFNSHLSRRKQSDLLPRSLHEKSERFPSVAFDTGDRQHDDVCMDGTGQDILSIISDWAVQESSPTILLLQGMAGTGKSTIARTVCRTFQQRNLLGASFFFSRSGIASPSYTDGFVATIASQLAETQSRAFRNALAGSLDKYPSIFETASDSQWQELVVNPLLQASQLETTVGDCTKSEVSSRPVIIVIDALDECNDAQFIKRLITTFVGNDGTSPKYLRILLTSRSNSDIDRWFHTSIDPRLFERCDMLDTPRDDDIRRFITNRLGTTQHAQSSLYDHWSTQKIIDRIVEQSAGLFIYAVVACNYLTQDNVIVEETLSFYMEDVPPYSTSSRRHGFDIPASLSTLDFWYSVILQDALRKSSQSQLRAESRCSCIRSVSASESLQQTDPTCFYVRCALGWVTVIHELLPLYAFAELVGQEARQLRHVLRHLEVVLKVPEKERDDQPITLCHPSFREFLQDEKRCTDKRFWVDADRTHMQIAEHSIRLMSATGGLRRDICQRHDISVRRQDFDQDTTETYIRLSLQYACRNWVPHLLQSERTVEEWQLVYDFLMKHFLHWLEAMAWMKKTKESLLQLRKLLVFRKNRDDHPPLNSFLWDAWRFGLHNGSMMRLAPLQLYASALVFAPETSAIRMQFLHSRPEWIERFPTLKWHWSRDLFQSEGVGDVVGATSFSPDSSLIASAFNNRSIMVCSVADPANPAVEFTLSGHSDWVCHISISHCGHYLASASRDKTVKIWNLKTGQQKWTLKGHKAEVRQVCFSPKPNTDILASASDDRTICIWDVKVGRLLRQLVRHSEWVRMVKFSPDGQQLASTGGDNRVFVWSTKDWRVLHQLGPHADFVIAMSFAHDSRQIASSSREISARIWDPQSGKQLRKLYGHQGWVRSVEFSPSTHRLVTASDDKTVRIWNTNTGAQLHRFTGHGTLTWSASFSPDGHQVISGFSNNTATIWNAETGRWKRNLEGHHGWVWAVQFSPDGQHVATSSVDNTVRLWDLRTGTEEHVLRHLQPHTELIYFSEDCTHVALVDDDHNITIWNSLTSTSIGTYSIPGSAIDHICFSKDHSYIQITLKDGSVQLRSTAKGRKLKSIPQNYTLLVPCAVDTWSFNSQDAGHRQQHPPSALDVLAQSRYHVDKFSITDEHWIRGDGEELLYLNDVYRDAIIAWRKNVMCIWQRSGAVMFLKAHESWELVSRSITPQMTGELSSVV